MMYNVNQPLNDSAVMSLDSDVRWSEGADQRPKQHCSLISANGKCEVSGKTFLSEPIDYPHKELIAVLIRTNKLDAMVAERYTKMVEDLEGSNRQTFQYERHVWLLNNMKQQGQGDTMPFQFSKFLNDTGVPVRIFSFTDAQLRRIYPKFENSWYNCEHSLIHFSNQHPEYTHYWEIENDVALLGNWERWFDVGDDLGPEIDLVSTVPVTVSKPDWFWYDRLSPQLMTANVTRYASLVILLRHSKSHLEMFHEKYSIRGEDAYYGFSETLLFTLSRYMNRTHALYPNLQGYINYDGPGRDTYLLFRQQGKEGIFHPVKGRLPALSERLPESHPIMSPR